MADPQEEKKFRDEFNRIMNDNQNRESMWGYPASEFDEGLELDYHEDSYHEESISHVHTDEELEGVIKEIVKNSHRLDSRDITVSVKDSNVHLTGTVRTQDERDYIISVVKLLHGVAEVKSDLIVKTHDGILPNDIGRH